ncbi:sh3 domain protein, partial [Diplocarpon rosae]
MTRPQIIRADSIDLQDQNAPSAQDHTRQPTNPAPLGLGPPAPHQAEALRELAVEAAEENHKSPRVSKEWSKGEIQHLQQYGDELAAEATSNLAGSNLHQQDDLATAQNGGLTGSTAEEADMADAEGDDGMDDDMMDKISSSPSIDDGGYFLPHLWPQRNESLLRSPPVGCPSLPQACCESSSPFVETPDHFPLRPPPDPIDKAEGRGSLVKRHRRHLLGEYLDGTGSESNYEDRTAESSPLPTGSGHWRVDKYDNDLDLDYLSGQFLADHLALPTDQMMLDLGGLTDAPGDGPSDELDPQRDELGITIPYESSEDEDDDYDIPYSADSRFVDSGWGGECLQELEDIDFEFVYALHTFIATVEGQANATKGDTMVLLDDSNSYWWLVRVVKDSSIGYLPAEHIETPTERLARLNKHRNIDLTSTMLCDQEAKSKNPLKKAIRRRNAKTVTFTAPTYVEASDVEYSTDEEDGEIDYFGQNGQQNQSGDQQDQRVEEEEAKAVEPLKIGADIREVQSESAEPESLNISSDLNRTSDEIFDGKLESKSRNGTLRNTDSFFKDDSVETMKITLTPNLLRDDSSTSTRTSNDSKEMKQRISLDKLEKDSPEKSKDKKDRKEKKEKEKKPGMLSGLFKRKEKKAKLSSIDDEVDDLVSAKRSTENQRVSPSPSKDSEETLLVETAVVAQIPARQLSKLQKQPRSESPSRKTAQTREPKILEPVQASGRVPLAESAPAPSMRVVKPEASTEQPGGPRNASPELTREQQPRNPSPEVTRARDLSPEATRGKAAALPEPTEQKNGTISKILRSASMNTSEPRPVKTKKAKSRIELDDFDSSSGDFPVEESTQAPSKQSQRPIPGSFPESYVGSTPAGQLDPSAERLSESPVQVSPSTPSKSYPPALMVDTSSQEEPPSPLSSPSPELIDAEDAQEKKGTGSSTTSTSTSTWSDAHLRTFFDDDAEIKDLLVVVYDKSGVVPAGPDHPVTGGLFKEENAKLAEITNRLDGMLGDWLARKMRTQSSR